MVAVGFVSEMFLYMGTAFDTSESFITAICKLISGQSEEDKHPVSNGLFSFFRGMNAAANGLLGITAILVLLSGGHAIGIGLLVVTILSVIGNSVASFACASSGVDKHDVAEGRRVVYDSGDVEDDVYTVGVEQVIDTVTPAQAVDGEQAEVPTVENKPILLSHRQDDKSRSSDELMGMGISELPVIEAGVR